MKYLLIYIISPAAVSFLVQSILCRKVKKGILRHGALLFPIISAAVGVYLLLTRCGDIFGGFGAIEAVLRFVAGCCACMGYGAAWLFFCVTRKGNSRKQEDQDKA